MRVKPRSWAWQWSELWKIRRGEAPEFKPKLRLFEMGEPESLARIAIRAGWWSMPACTVQAFLQYWGCAVPKGVSLVKLIHLAAKHFFSCDNGKAVDFVHARLATKSDKSELLRELLEIDEAIQVLDRDDVQGVQQEQRRAIAELEDKKAFVEEYVALKTKVVKWDETVGDWRCHAAACRVEGEEVPQEVARERGAGSREQLHAAEGILLARQRAQRVVVPRGTLQAALRAIGAARGRRAVVHPRDGAARVVAVLAEGGASTVRVPDPWNCLGAASRVTGLSTLIGPVHRIKLPLG